MKIRHSFLAIILIIAFVLNSSSYVFADKFWDLYKKGEEQKNSGDVLGAISTWKEITRLYENDTSRDGIIKSAVYWTKIAEAYNVMGWFGEAQQAYDKVDKLWTSIGENDSAWGPNRIATRLNTDIRVYAKVPVDKNQKLGKFEPLSGSYFGAPFDKDSKIGTNLENVQDVYGKKHTAFLMYVRWGEPLQDWTARQAKELNAALQIAWEPPADMSGIKSGDVSKFAKQLNDIGVPVFLRFASEMNEISNPWSQNSPETYKKAYKMVADIMHKEAPNVAMIWAPLYVPMDKINSFYPGDDAVDWVGVDAYTDRYYIGDPSTKSLIEDLYYQGYFANPLDRFQYIYDNYSNRKPIFIAETGVQNYAMNTKEDFSDWASNNLKRLYGYLPMYYPKIKAIFYFNVDSNLVPGLGLKQNYSLSKSQKVFETYKSLIKNDYFLSNVGTSVNYAYKPIEEVSTLKTKFELSTYAKIISPFVSKVEYWVDGKKTLDSSEIPFKAEIDLSRLSDGKHILKVDVFDEKGNELGKRIYTISINGSNVSFEAGQVEYLPRHKTFNDMGNHWAKQDIEKLVSLWSVDGYDDGSFKPENTITRAEFYKMLSSALGMNLEASSDVLKNVSADHWAKGILEGGAYLDIIKPSLFINFNPNEKITREEMATLAVRALNGGKDLTVSDTNFKDNINISEKYRGYIGQAVKFGVIEGFPDGTFRAKDNATRAQAASMIVDVLDLQRRLK